MTIKNKGERKCVVCDRIIKIYEEAIGNHHNGRKFIILSDEGLFWNDHFNNSPRGVWFCNECFEKILRHYRSKTYLK